MDQGWLKSWKLLWNISVNLFGFAVMLVISTPTNQSSLFSKTNKMYIYYSISLGYYYYTTPKNMHAKHKHPMQFSWDRRVENVSPTRAWLPENLRVSSQFHAKKYLVNHWQCSVCLQMPHEHEEERHNILIPRDSLIFNGFAFVNLPLSSLLPTSQTYFRPQLPRASFSVCIWLSLSLSHNPSPHHPPDSLTSHPPITIMNCRS